MAIHSILEKESGAKALFFEHSFLPFAEAERQLIFQGDSSSRRKITELKNLSD